MQGDYTFTAKSQPHRRAVVGDMLQAMKDQESGKAIILDARSEGQFTGEVCAPSVQNASWFAPLVKCMLKLCTWFTTQHRSFLLSCRLAAGGHKLPLIAIAVHMLIMLIQEGMLCLTCYKEFSSYAAANNRPVIALAQQQKTSL